MKLKLTLLLLTLSPMMYASQLDSKSLFIGVGLGLGTYASRQYIAKPVAKATKKAAKKTAYGAVHIVTLGKK
jgi:hypothetical protein